ncbi:UNVERIFIED_CONTAM: LIM domain-containing protein WLIM2b [Sesamum calycinum]|uniref:LIM domain-containing protein WLIM2b n=1 Tax=Sesamum calycinum TaxID=2727403 RepID=A0AAW2LSY9_9LAMI
MEGVLYCKPHYEQLFKETGSFSKNFQSPAKSAEKLTPELTRSPSKAAGMFSGTQDKCATCGKTAYPLEKALKSRAETLVAIDSNIIMLVTFELL